MEEDEPTGEPKDEFMEDVELWGKQTCPICLEPPHNAVLLECSSHDIGCRPYICDTTEPLTKCLNQFRNSSRQPRCPLCRGRVAGQVVVEPARELMDSRPRGCLSEGCDFVGVYPELRVHGHPLAPHAKVDPELERTWRRLEAEWAALDLSAGSGRPGAESCNS